MQLTSLSLALTRAGFLTFSPSSLFTAGEQGVWYDPSDFDRYMAPLGPELVANGDFSNGTTGWTNTTELLSAAVISGAVRLTVNNNGSAAGIRQTPTFTVGKVYRVTGSIRSVSGASVRISILNSGGDTFIVNSTDVTSTAFTTVTVTFTATEPNNQVYLRVGATNGVGEFDNISVRELTAIDTATLFQDSAGTTPVTAVEQPVGLMLDKSKGLVLGPELVVNGTFNADLSGWSQTTGTIQWSSGALLAGPGGVSGRGTQTLSLTASRYYEIKVTITAGVNGIIRFGVDATGATGSGLSLVNLPVGTYTYIAVATASTMYLSVGSATSATIDNISVRELPGNHAFQTTATSRPVLSARVNLLTKTEQFDDAAWSTTSGVTFSSGVAAFADGAYRYQAYTHGTSIAGLAFTARVKLHSPTGKATIVLRVSGVSTPSDEAALVVNLTSTPTVYTLTRTFTSTNTGIFVGLDNRPTEGGDGIAGDVVATEWSIVPANQADLPYQRVNTATDYDSDPAKFPRFLRCDGIDDGMVTSTITPGTDKVTVFAGVRKLSDAALGAVVELGVLGAVGTFGLGAPGGASPTYRFASHGTVFSSALSASSFASPNTAVLSGLGDISGDRATLRVNGTQVAQSTEDQGTGNYLAYPLYLFRRGGTTFPFNGNFYGGIIRFGDNLPIETIEQTEAWMAAKTGVTLA